MKKSLITPIIYLALLLLVHTVAFSQEGRTYDLNGNLVTDTDKQIVSRHYNHLNLVDTIIYEDGHRTKAL
jgi:hypothetical protein